MTILGSVEMGTEICVRCRARKKLYKVGSAYSSVDTGGELVDCPMCLGVGRIKKMEFIPSDLEVQPKEFNGSISIDKPREISSATVVGKMQIDSLKKPGRPKKGLSDDGKKE